MILSVLSDTNGQKMSLFEYIEKNNKKLEITWKSIADALKNIDYRDLGKSIQEKYCLQHEDTNTTQ